MPVPIIDLTGEVPVERVQVTLYVDLAKNVVVCIHRDGVAVARLSVPLDGGVVGRIGTVLVDAPVEPPREPVS